ncbi:MAG: glycosyltransferase family 4 protein [Ginsengibacter sp.]
MKKLAIITTHPIQYNAPMFAMLHQRANIALKVFYTWGDTVLKSKYDPGFNKAIEWDIPLLEGYEYEFLENVSKKKGSHHYNGIINPDIIKKINEWRADVLLVYGWKFNSHLRVMRHFKNKIPVWFRGDSTLLDEKKGLKSFFKTILLRWVYKHVDIAFFTGANNKEYFLHNGLKPYQLIKAFHAIDNERFQNIDSRYFLQVEQLKTKLKISPNSLIFLYAGKLESKKGVENILNAFMAFKNKSTHLLIVGNGPEERKLKNLYSEVTNVTFLDFQNQMIMPVIYQLCDVYVLASTGPGESWGLSINEAMAAGKAILASDKCGGAVDLIVNGLNGFIFEAGNVADLTSKMQMLSESSMELAIMQQNSKELIQRFTFMEFIYAIETRISNGNNS